MCIRDRDANTAEHFATTINQLKGKVTMLFITHALPKSLLVDGVVRIGGDQISVLNTSLPNASANTPTGTAQHGPRQGDFA